MKREDPIPEGDPRASRPTRLGKISMLPMGLRLLISPAATLLVYVVQLLLSPWLGMAPFVFFYVGVALSAVLGGFLPGILAVLLSATVANYSFVGGQLGWSTSVPELTATALFFVAGSAEAWLCSSLRKTAIRAQQVAEDLARQRSVFALSHDAIFVWRPDKGIESWNRGAEEAYGFTTDEARGRIPYELLQTRFPREWTEICSQLETQKRWEGDLVHRTKDGRAVNVSARLQYVSFGDGHDRILESSRDISEGARSRDELLQKEQRLRAIFENVVQGIAEVNSDARVENVNGRLCELLGYREDELIGMSIHELTAPEDRDQSRDLNGRLLRGECDRFDYEKRYLTKSGSTVWVHVTVSAIRDSQGKVLRGVGTIEDITERKRAQDALRASEERLRLAQQVARIGSFEFFPETSMSRWSREQEALHGLPAGGYGGSYEQWAALVHPDDLPRVERCLREALDAGGFETEWRVVWPDGTVHWLSGRGQVFEDGEGRPVRLVGVNLDITARKEAEAGLLRSREGLRKLTDASLSVVAKTDLGEMLQAISDAALALTGARMATSGHGLVSGQFAVGGSARAPGAPECPAGEMFRFEKGGVYMALVEGAEAIRLTDAELRAHARWWGLPEGHVPMRGLLGARMLTRNGRTNGVILVTDKDQGDFTEEDEGLLRQLGTVAGLALQHVENRMSLEDSDRRKTEFLAMLSHELRNPLAPIRNSLHVLERCLPGTEQARRAQSVIDRQVAHLTRLVDDLLDVTRISRGKIQLQRERLDLRDLARRAADDYSDAFAQNHLALESSLPERAMWIHADRTRIAQVIGNLLANSVKFTPAGGKASVSVERDLGEAVLTVRDTGIGIAPEMLPRVFEAFAQADTTLDRSRGGLGLGLAMVKGLVEMHGGTASVKSPGVGHGAEFTIRLPLDLADLSAEEPLRRTAIARGARRVLVIEDNVDAAESMREVLELGEHTVEVAFSGTDGLTKARGFGPDVVLCDIGLPGMDGYEVARSMRKDPALRSAKLVALTGYAAPEDVSKAHDAGFDAHLAKPPNLEKLEELIAGST